MDAPTAQTKLKKLQEEVNALKEERDFLREQLKAALQRPSTSSHSSPGKWNFNIINILGFQEALGNIFELINHCHKLL